MLPLLICWLPFEQGVLQSELIMYIHFQAGMCDESSAERLLVLLEPEAAAVQCREQILQEMMNNS
jgi:hypothetical protein